jgi:hypothetical protein
MAVDARLLSLHVYPVKSCAGIAVESATLGARGLEYDRHWMIVDAAGRFLTQRTHPRLAIVRTALRTATVELTAPGAAPLELPLAQPGDGLPARTVRIWNDEVAAIDCGARSAAWISAVLGTEAAIVRAAASMRREPDIRWRGTVPAPVDFPDAFPLLVCNAASLADLQRRMPEGQPLSMERFRPNIVIDGPPAYAEDTTAEVVGDGWTLRLVKPCTRCSTTAVDPLTGVPGANPLPVLRGYRFDRDLRGVTFGQNAVIVSGAGRRLRVGEALMLRPRPAMPAAPPA